MLSRRSGEWTDPNLVSHQRDEALGERLFQRAPMKTLPLGGAQVHSPPDRIDAPGDLPPPTGNRSLERVAEDAGLGGGIDAGAGDRCRQISGEGSRWRPAAPEG